MFWVQLHVKMSPKRRLSKTSFNPLHVADETFITKIMNTVGTNKEKAEEKENGIENEVRELSAMVRELRAEVALLKEELGSRDRRGSVAEEKEAVAVQEAEDAVRMWLTETVRLPQYFRSFMEAGFDDLDSVAHDTYN